MVVYNDRPWFINGLNLVLSPWVPLFDSFSAIVGRIDQWICVPKVPWEFWNKNSLSHLLKHVAEVIKLDQHTLLMQKGRFTRVYVNIDITKPLCEH